MNAVPTSGSNLSERRPVETILGYLNFSAGRPEPSVHSAFNDLFVEIRPRTWEEVHSTLVGSLEALADQKPAFQNAEQAHAVLSLTFNRLLLRYLRHHADLLFHLSAEDLLNPFFLARCCEAVLAAGGPWTEEERVANDALTRLNDFVGHRPVAVLENGRKAEVYPHERFRPLPLYLRGAGAAVGPYQQLIEHALAHIAATPRDLLEQASFDPARLDELALDVRAHDALHPVFKRTNYLFGEWDPHLIDNQGHFRRFVLRKVILDALVAWIDQAADPPPAERLNDASAVLAGTILMASAISGWGPAAHDSTISLTSLLPVVARQRDAFYTQMMSRFQGSRAERLARVVETTRQPFGHVRQQLNIYLANYASAQMQRRTVAEQFSRMGFDDAARSEAAKIPAASVRMECELNNRLEAAKRCATRGAVAEAADRLSEATDLLVRGIESGALIDPWNILAFQGQFPLFVAREDAVPDPRAEWLIGFMDDVFTVGGDVLTEAAAGGEAKVAMHVHDWLDQTAAWWDRYATATVSDLPAVRGADRVASATAVAETIAEWRAGGRSTGDMSFWSKRVGRLESPEAFAHVVEVLLHRRDLVAASGLLIQWLSQAEFIGLGEEHASFFNLALRWLRELTVGTSSPSQEEQVQLCRRFLDFIEANAGDFWTVPPFADPALGDAPAVPDELATGSSSAEDDDGASIFSAAYEGVVYRDSTADGNEGEVLDSSPSPHGGEFEDRLRLIEPRLRFLDMLALLWRITAGRIAGDDFFQSSIEHWRSQAAKLSSDLAQFARTIERQPLGAGSGDLEANVEYDAQLQSKNQLLHLVTTAAVHMASAERLLKARSQALRSFDHDEVDHVLRALLAADTVSLSRAIPPLLRRLSKEALLYVAVEHGGDSGKAIAARGNHDLLMILATELPRLGMLREARQVLRTALRMERKSRPTGQSVTEFDRLFRTTFETVLRTAVHSQDVSNVRRNLQARGFQRGSVRAGHLRRTTAYAYRVGKKRPGRAYRHFRARPSDVTTVSVVGAVVERYLDIWLRHAATMRLTAVEVFNDTAIWTDAKRFIRRFGSELFHARVLPLSNLRAILHEGVDKFLDHLVENDDPMHPSRLVAAIEANPQMRDQIARLLSLIYAAVVDEIERFVEYNSTTTQSDYGDRFDSFLDFLRAEAAYRRDEWDLTPLRIAHEVLATANRGDAARLWEEVVRDRTAAVADKHLRRLNALEKRHAMRLPSISDRLAERFVKRFAVDRMISLIPMAVRDAQSGRRESPPFRALRREVDAYLETSTGSAAELPDWLDQFEAAVSKALGGSSVMHDERDTVTGRPLPRMRRGQVLRQIMLQKKQPPPATRG